MSEISSFHKLIAASVIPTLIALLQVKYQTQNPFDTHPVTMLVAVSSVMVYYLLHLSVLRHPMNHFTVLQNLLVSSAYATFSILTYPLFPDWATLYLYVISGLLLAGKVLYMFRDKLRIERVFVFLKNRWGDVVKFFLRKPDEPILPIHN